MGRRGPETVGQDQEGATYKQDKGAVPTGGDPLEQNHRYPQRGQELSGTRELQALAHCGGSLPNTASGCGFRSSTACPSSTSPPGGAREQAMPASQGREPPSWRCCLVPSLSPATSCQALYTPALPSPGGLHHPLLFPSAHPTVLPPAGTLPTLHLAHSSFHQALPTQFQVTSSRKPSGFSPPCPQPPRFSSHVLAVITVSWFSPCLCLPSPLVG